MPARSTLARGVARLQVGELLRLCEAPGCRRWAATHPWLRRDGIVLDQAWLCSPRCFETVLLRLLSSPSKADAPARPLAANAAERKPRLPRMPFRLLLLQEGYLAEQDLRRAAAYAARQALPLEGALLALGVVREEHLAWALAEEKNSTFYTLPPVRLAAGLHLPPLLAERAQAAVVHGTQTRVLVGFLRRIDRELLEAVEQVLGVRAEGCFVTAAHARLQRTLDEEALAADRHRTASVVANAAEAARAVLAHAVRFGAERVHVVRACGLIWARAQNAREQSEDSLLCLEPAGSRDGTTATRPAQEFCHRA